MKGLNIARSNLNGSLNLGTDLLLGEHELLVRHLKRRELHAVNLCSKCQQSIITLLLHTLHDSLDTLGYERVILLGSATQRSPLPTLGI